MTFALSSLHREYYRYVYIQDSMAYVRRQVDRTCPPPKEHAHGRSLLLGLWRVDCDEQLAEESKKLARRRVGLEEQRRTRLAKGNERVGRARGVMSKVSDFQHQRSSKQSAEEI